MLEDVAPYLIGPRHQLTGEDHVLNLGYKLCSPSRADYRLGSLYPALRTSPPFYRLCLIPFVPAPGSSGT